MIPHHWDNLHQKGMASFLLFCWKVHSDLHLCFLREKDKAQEAGRILWTLTLAMKEDNQAMTG
jgi:hypothetical protein